MRPPIVCHPKAGLLDILRELKKGKSHLALVTEQVEQLELKLGITKNRSKTSAVKREDIIILGKLDIYFFKE